jgi:CubicO group peptidase (beta-lactamase class C family)
MAAWMQTLTDEQRVDVYARLAKPGNPWLKLTPKERGQASGKTVTIRQLLSHTSGIYDHFENPRYLKISGAEPTRQRATGALATTAILPRTR